MTSSRLDILLYCHDGRGIGHASRSIAIGMALRRLHPNLKVLFVSGTPHTQELRGNAPLDWIKLPGYETVVKDGKSKGINGKSNFSDHQLGELRATMLKQVLSLYQPRLVVADHSPLGKHKELLPALKASSLNDIRWVLGVRGVVGNVRQVQAPLATEVYNRYYHSLVWYGDSQVLGPQHCQKLAAIFDTRPFETGYVSRMAELEACAPAPGIKANVYAGTLAIPWFGESSKQLLKVVGEVLSQIDSSYGQWLLYLPKEYINDKTNSYISNINKLTNCNIHPFGPSYHEALACSRVALIYGGYNSITDVLHAKVPTVVLERGMQDDEQQQHLYKLSRFTHDFLTSVSENDLQTDKLYSLLIQQLQRSQDQHSPSFQINLNGAKNAANHLAGLL